MACLRSVTSLPHVRCPRCSFLSTLPSLESLPPNYALLRHRRERSGLSDCDNCFTSRAEQYCYDCPASLCGGCAASIHANAVFKAHRTTPTAAFAATCGVHPRRHVVRLCRPCAAPACADCAAAHRGHPAASVADAAAAARADAPRLAEALRRAAIAARERRAPIDDAVDAAAEAHRDAEGRVRAAFAGILREVEGRKTELIKAIRESEERVVAALSQQREVLRATEVMSEEALFTLSSVMVEGPPSPFPSNDAPTVAVSILRAQEAVLKDVTSRPIIGAPCVSVTEVVNITPASIAAAVASIRALGTLIPSDVGGAQLTYDGSPTSIGVLYFLGCREGRASYTNPALSGAIQVEASSIGDGRVENICAATLESFCTDDERESWIAIRLPRILTLTTVALSQSPSSPDAHFPRKLHVQILTDTGDWETVLEAEPVGLSATTSRVWLTLKDPHHTKGVRVVQLGHNSHSTHHFAVTQLELYGQLWSMAGPPEVTEI